MTLYRLVCCHSHPEGYVDIVNYDAVFGRDRAKVASPGSGPLLIGVAQPGYPLDVLQGLDYVQTIPGTYPVFSKRAIECFGNEFKEDATPVDLEVNAGSASIRFSIAIVTAKRALVDEKSSDFMTLAGIRFIKNVRFMSDVEEDFMIARDSKNVRFVVSDKLRNVAIDNGLRMGFSPI